MKKMTMKEELQEEYKIFLTIEAFQDNGISIKFLPSVSKEVIPQILFNFYSAVYLKNGYTGKIEHNNK